MKDEKEPVQPVADAEQNQHESEGLTLDDLAKVSGGAPRKAGERPLEY